MSDTPAICAETKLAVFARSEGYCEGCATGKAAHEHWPRGAKTDQQSPANWVHLCEACHKKATLEPHWAFYQGWALRYAHDPAWMPLIWRGRALWLTHAGKLADQPPTEAAS